MINDPEVQDPSTEMGKKFRLRFRVPFPVFRELLDLTLKLGFQARPQNAAKTAGVPLEIQVLGVLRVLGRGCCFDGIEEISNVDEETHRRFFHEFCAKFAKQYYKDYVYTPRNEEEMHAWSSDYEVMGLPGAMGSTDCVHVKWDRCPVSLSNLCTGKEGYPTLAFQATVNHKMRFMSCTESFYGSNNDKTICKFDQLTMDIKNKVLFQDKEFTLYTESGEEVRHRGGYLICDGGFMMWRCLMTGYKYYSKFEEAIWSAQMESTRKDVERAFGILKGRFRCLKLPIVFQKREYIDNIMFTCIILHNMILTSDGRDQLWEDGVKWDGVDGEHDVADEEWVKEKLKILKKRALRKLTDYSAIGRRNLIDLSEDAEAKDEEFFTLRVCLINHYYFMYKNHHHKLKWLN
jgi:hypothetical protein